MFKSRTYFILNASDHNIQTFERVVLRDIAIMENQRKKIKYNISRDKRIALMNLTRDKDIIIKQADKGGGVLILDKKDYETEVFRQLQDQTSYCKLQRDPTKDYSNVLKVIVRE